MILKTKPNTKVSHVELFLSHSVTVLVSYYNRTVHEVQYNTNIFKHEYSLLQQFINIGPHQHDMIHLAE